MEKFILPNEKKLQIAINNCFIILTIRVYYSCRQSSDCCSPWIDTKDWLDAMYWRHCEWSLYSYSFNFEQLKSNSLIILIQQLRKTIDPYYFRLFLMKPNLFFLFFFLFRIVQWFYLIQQKRVRWIGPDILMDLNLKHPG